MNAIKSLFNYIFLVIFSYIFIVVAFSFAINSVWSLLIACVLIVLVIFLSKKLHQPAKFNYKIAWRIIFIISIALLLLTAFLLAVKSEWGAQNWDFSKLYRTAYEYTHKMPYTTEYYARYKNNVFWVSVLILLIKIIELFVGTISFATFVNISAVISCLMIWLAFFFIHKTAKTLWDEKKAFYVGLIGVCCLPLYLYSQFLYTDSPAILLVAVLIYLYTKVRMLAGPRKYIICGLMGFLSATLFNIKLTAFLVVVAIVLDSLTKISKAKTYFLCLGISIVVACASFFLCSGLSHQYLNITQKESVQREFPPTHWVMMGLNNTSIGGYYQKDVDYTYSYPNYDAKKDANIKEIKHRVENYGFTGFMKHTFVRKVIRTWGASDLASTDYLCSSPRYKDSFMYNLFAAEGKYSFLTNIYNNIYFVFIYIGLLLSVLFAIRKKDYSLNVLRISLIGIMIFLSVWECNSRYLLTFTPVLIILGADGLYQFLKRKR